MTSNNNPAHARGGFVTKQLYSKNGSGQAHDQSLWDSRRIRTAAA